MCDPAISESADGKLMIDLPPLRFGGRPGGSFEIDPFPLVLKACLESMGRRFHADYLYGVSGACFRLIWRPGAWSFANQHIYNMAPDPYEPVRRGFRSAGFGVTILERAAATDEYQFRRAVIESIDQGRPVISFDEAGEAAAICGCAEGGRVVIGRSFYQDPPDLNQGITFEPGGYFRRAAWEKDTTALALFGAEEPLPDPQVLYLDALRWAARVMQMGQVGSRVVGLDAFDAWAADLQCKEVFAIARRAVLDAALTAGGEAAAMLGEGRLHAAGFLDLAAAACPQAAGALQTAAGHFREEHRLMTLLWILWLNGSPDQAARRRALASHEVRRESVALIRECKLNELAALNWIEEAVKA